MGDSLQAGPLALMALIVVAAGITRGFTGFGAGLIMVPTFSLLLGPALAVPIVVLLDALAGIPLMPASFRLVRWRTLAPLAVAAWLMIPLGSMGLVRLDPNWLRRAISVVVLLMAAVLWTGWRYRRRPGPLVSASAGAVGGFLTGIAGVGGPPVVLFYLAGSDPASASRAGLIWFLAFNQLIALGSYGYAGLLTRTTLWSALIMAPVFLLAVHGGARLFGRVNERLFRRLALAFLFVIGLVGAIY